MAKMKKLLTTVTWLLVGACSGQQAAEAPPSTAAAPPEAAEPPAAANAAAPAAQPAAPTPPAQLTGEEKAKLFESCWAAFNAKDWAKFAPCYAETAQSEDVDSGMPRKVGRNDIVEGAKAYTAQAPDVTGEAQLVLVNGEHVASVLLLKGTNSGPLMGPGGAAQPATNKKFGVLIAHAAELEATGPVLDDRFYMDASSYLGQLGLNPGPHRPLLETSPTKEVVVASGSDEEKANLALVAHAIDLFNQHDSKALLAMMTDDFVLSDSAAPADFVGKKAVQKSYDELFKGFHDVKLSVDKSWAAGKYVVSEGTFSGTNDGAVPSMKLKKTGKHVSVRFLEVDEVSNGKLARQRIFDNGLAFAMQLGLVPPPGAASKPGEGKTPDAKKPAGKTTESPPKTGD
jgi:predicted ester cyclase